MQSGDVGMREMAPRMFCEERGSQRTEGSRRAGEALRALAERLAPPSVAGAEGRGRQGLL